MDDDSAERSRKVAALFDQVASSYDAVGVEWFRPIARGLLAEVSPQPGERAVDIGCGRGAVLLPLAQAVGPTGHVTGFDLSAEMVRQTQADVDASGMTHVDLVVTDASAPALPATTYDLAVASLVVFFLPEPVRALRAWRELLVPGGRLGISTFADRDPRWMELDAVFKPYAPPGVLDPRTRESGPFGSDAGVTGLLEEAGFADIRTSQIEVPAVFRDEDHWHTWSWSHGQRVMWEWVPAEERPAVRDAAYAVLADCHDADGAIRLAQRVRFTLGVSPGRRTPRP